jgi:hypothetical protein
MKIVAVHIYMRYHKKRNEKEGFLGRVIHKYERKVSIDEIKMDIAKTIEERKAKTQYYYVLVVVRRPDRTLGYRTVIRKTLVAA